MGVRAPTLFVCVLCLRSDRGVRFPSCFVFFAVGVHTFCQVLILLRLIKTTRGEGWVGENLAPLVVYAVNTRWCAMLLFLFVISILAVFVCSRAGAIRFGCTRRSCCFLPVFLFPFFFSKLARHRTMRSE